MIDHKEFIGQVKRHKMTIEDDNGVHRSILFKAPNTGNRHFRLTTWRGHLCISGDMGSYVFSRLDDMFEFFRDDTGAGRINPDYWSQKVQSEDKYSKVWQFSETAFREEVERQTKDWETTLENVDNLREAIEDATQYVENENDAIAAMYDFSHDGHSFDTDDLSFKELGDHYLWDCRAIVWGIKQYDLFKQGRTQADHDAKVLAGKL